MKNYSSAPTAHSFQRFGIYILSNLYYDQRERWWYWRSNMNWYYNNTDSNYFLFLFFHAIPAKVELAITTSPYDHSIRRLIPIRRISPTLARRKWPTQEGRATESMARYGRSKSITDLFLFLILEPWHSTNSIESNWSRWLSIHSSQRFLIE